MLKANKYRILTQIYNDLYSRAREITDSHNACGMDSDFICIRNRILKDQGRINISYGCCGDPFDRDRPIKCQFLIPGEGCKAKCLYCATYICDVVEQTLPEEAVQEMKDITNAMYVLGLARFRKSMLHAVSRVVFPELDVEQDLARDKGRHLYRPDIIDKLSAAVPIPSIDAGELMAVPAPDLKLTGGEFGEVVADPTLEEEKEVLSAYQNWLVNNPDMSLLPVEEARRRFEDGVLGSEHSKLASIILDIKMGDILLGGKFKNVRVKVKKVGKDDKGQPTVNGKSLLNFYIEKFLPEKRKSKNTREKNLKG